MAVTKEILTLAVETGDALLRNGAEVYRVEDTVLHILKAYETDIDFRIHALKKQRKWLQSRNYRYPAWYHLSG